MKTLRWFVTPLALGALLLFVGCSKGETEPTPVKANPNDTAKQMMNSGALSPAQRDQIQKGMESKGANK